MVVSIVLALVIGLFVGVPAVKSVLAFARKPEGDLTRIRANLGGIVGPAGVYRRVLSVRYTGGEIATRYSPARRKYLAVIEHPKGGAEERTVWIEVTFFGYGALTLDPKS